MIKNLPFRSICLYSSTRSSSRWRITRSKSECPSHFFAASEIKTALHYLLLKYDIKNLNGKKVYPQIKGPFRFSSDEGLVFERKKNIQNV